MYISLSFARALERRLERLVNSVKPEPADHRTADLLRLARKDMCKLRNYVSKAEKESQA